MTTSPRSFTTRIANYRGIRSPSAIRNTMRATAHWYGFTGWRFYR